MKRKFSVLLVLLLTVLLFVACTEETTSLRAEKDFFYLSLNGTVDLQNYVVREGNGKLYFAVENPDVLRLDGSKLTGVAVGTGAVLIESGDFFVRILVEVVDDKKIAVVLEDTEEEYDGTAKLPRFQNALPTGSTVVFYQNGKAFTGAVDAGTYELSAEVTVPSPFHVEYEKTQATLTVTPKTIRLTDVRFTSETHTYDGTQKTLTVQGTLPEGVTVRYENNSATETGTYRAVASFLPPDEKNYAPIPSLEARLTITKKYVNLASLGFASATLTYDGKPHSLALPSGLPEGVEASYYMLTDGEKVPLSDDFSFTDSGVYAVYLSLVAPADILLNYAFALGSNVLSFTDTDASGIVRLPTDLSAVLTIRKCFMPSDYKWSLTCDGVETASVPYGEQFSIGGDGKYSLRLVGSSHGVNGEFPQGVTFEYLVPDQKNYTASGFLKCGTYPIGVQYTLPAGADKNYYPPDEKLFSLTVSRAVIDMSNVRFHAAFSTATYSPDADYNDFYIDASQMENFDDFLTYSYTYRKNGTDRGEWKGEGEIQSAGSYEIVATFNLINADKEYYVTPEPMTVQFTIAPLRIRLDAVLESKTIVYDTNAHELSVVGDLPEGSSLYYIYDKTQSVDNFRFTDAGTYEIRARFPYRGWAIANYVYYNDSGEFDELQATLTIEKAPAQVDPALFIQSETPTYSPSLKLSDFSLSHRDDENEDWFIRFKDADKKVTLSRYDPATHVGWFTAELIYNKDSRNYIDCVFSKDLSVLQKEIKLTDATVPTQFIAYTDGKITPVVRFTGEDMNAALTITLTTNDGLRTLGKHLCTVTLAPKEPNHYYCTGTSTLTGVEIYLYNGVLYTYSPGTTILQKYKGGERTVSLPNGTTGVLAGAFATADVTRYLTLPDSLTFLADNSLSGAVQLEELTMPKAFSLSDAFDRSVPTTLVSVTVTTDTTVPSKAFFRLERLEKVTYLKEVTTVGEYAFEGCSSLSELVFPNVPIYSQYALCDCSALTELTVRSFPSATYYFGHAEKTDYALRRLVLIEGTTLSDDAFSGLPTVEEIVLPNTLTSLGKRAFCGSSASVDLSALTLTTTGENAFEGFAGEATFPASLETLSSYAFYQCVSATLTFPKAVTTIEANAFTACSAEVFFPADSSLTAVGASAFIRYAGSSVHLPSSVKTYGAHAFEESKITSIELASDVTIGKECFKNSALTSAIVSCQTISEEAFSGCQNLVSLLLIGTVNIESGAFGSCVKLSEVTLPDSLLTLGSHAFSSCSSLSVFTFTAEVPPTVRTVFSSDKGISFYVPLVALPQYENYLSSAGCDMDKCSVTGQE